MDKYEKRRQRLIQIRDEMCGGKAVNVARKISREPSYVSRMLYEEGKNGKKRIADDMVEIIEKSFDLPPGWMDGINVDQDLSYVGSYRKREKYPLISWVSAGAWCYADEPYSLSDVSEWYESETTVYGRGFWLRVEGDSMTAPTGLSIPEGTLVLFDTGREPDNGNLVIAKLEDSNEATFKKLIIDGGRRYLKGLNPAWPLVPINGNCIIIAVAVQTMMKLV
ncbi:LexA family transcriptional repressor [Salmonella enterica subsp. enterica serovar Newport]|uniref:LexA family transcriptional repressor n=1 Tax=Salmonella newport TaxID=108619 RepID=A0A5Y0S7R6_SALNE|nr:LexA family transcriptional repressor [Salmonella enterica subsp. enterica serovar Newport]EBS4409092.1 LexA family transcriptional repressor [Salmonella enterica subsp. enterica serovar Newport]ECB7109883.1 LexA family transcriptional repressor [Salmonella enterica subsp. enterica serovar Newport]ECF2112714.1 LexA family transcriptional repressor [Salmonella enterica subsp. enterica serovar Newport]ECJ3621932.1 LexA family transcriptional repressor [Salmonella enterica subsp. enterica serov